MTEDRKPKSLNDADIKTGRKVNRRSVLNMLGIGAAGSATLLASGTRNPAHAADIDNGAWTDRASCPRGTGGVWTGITDADNGNITDAGGYGRGAPYC